MVVGRRLRVTRLPKPALAGWREGEPPNVSGFFRLPVRHRGVC